jgi:hypothetical protein
MLVLAAALSARIRGDRFSVTDSYDHIRGTRECADWYASSRKGLQ